MSRSFEEILALLAAENVSLPSDRLTSLSDLDRKGLERFVEVWQRLSVDRRRLLIERLGDQADRHIELTFEIINRHAITDPDEEVRRLAIRNLWECEDPKLVPPLLDTLRSDPSLRVRAEAAIALGRFLLLGELEKIPPQLLAEIEELFLEVIAEDPDSSLFCPCVEALGYSSRQEVIEIIERAYASSDDSRKRSALLAMGRSYNRRWVDTILREMQSPSPILRSEAARAAGELEMREAVPTLLELLDDVHELVRRAAVWSLGQIGGDQAERALSRLKARGEDPQMAQDLEDALDHISFLKGTPDFMLLDFDELDEDLTD